MLAVFPMSRQHDQVASGEIQTTAKRPRGKVEQRRRGNITKQYQEQIKRCKKKLTGKAETGGETRTQHKDKIKGGNNGHGERNSRFQATSKDQEI